MTALVLGQFISSILVLISFLFAWGLGVMIYNLYFHPLSVYPGPKSFIATSIPLARSFLRGSQPRDVKHLHDIYGDVVRIGPNDLSFINADAWKDIYGHRPGKSEMEKDKKFYLNGGPAPPGDILTANEADHSRFRRLLSRSFSEKALRDQEPLIRTYVDLLISRLHRRIQAHKPVVDLVSWYNWTTFDLIGDLAFGAPFNCLQDESYHYWVSNVFYNVKANTLFNIAKNYPGIMLLAQLMMPRRLREARDNHVKLTIERVEARMELKTDRPDFLSPILNNQDEKMGMTKQELMGIANLLMIAGSETTATLLSGVTYHLLRSPRVMQKLIAEVRSKFTSENQINLTSVQNLDYMLAVLDEALRIYPPSPTGLPRVVGEGGDYVCGKWVAEGTSVSISQWAANHSSYNFTQPESFIPERFLGDPQFDSDKKHAMQPFSVGPRNCIGRVLAYSEMRLILSRMIWNFDIKLVDDSQNWIDQQQIYTFWEKVPLQVVLTPVVRD